MTMFENPEKVREKIQRGFEGLRVLVVGDLMLDQYLRGGVERVSPEAPVPVVRLDHKTLVAGGAANVAANLKGLGCEVSAVGVLGADGEGGQLLGLLQAAGVETTAIVSTPTRPTTCKMRILGGQQQILRLDVEKVGELEHALKRRVIAGIETQIADCSAIILSDYAKGLLDHSVCQYIIGRARELSIPTFVDPKGLHHEKYARCEVISPNRTELAAATSTDCGDLESLLRKGEQLRSDLEISHLVVTLGENGITLSDSGGIRRFPALAREVFDVSGAGDTVIATICAGVAAGLHLHDAIRLANMAAGIVISKVGTVPITREELLARFVSEDETDQMNKVCSSETLSSRVTRWHTAGQRIVFTNGCFDLFHVGHLALLEQAKREGDILVVALNSDRSVRDLKGPSRPIISQEARARLVAALPCVDAVVVFDEETPLHLIRMLRPDVLVKGGDYTEDEVVGARDMKEWGGRVALIPVVEGFSTTSILKRAIASLREGSPEPIQ